MSGGDRLGGRKTLRVGEFLSQWETDGLKRRIEITELFGSFGIALSKKGKSWVGRCPWHEDKTPSLSVDGERGLYHCFGCGESGDAVTLVKKMKGMGFKEACLWLKEWSGEAGPPQRGSAEPAALGEMSLEVVAGHYAKSLGGAKRAREYLASRGLGDPGLAVRYGFGYADGSLLDLTSNGQVESLKELGILSSKGREHFAGCLVFPLHDEGGRTVGLYGRAVDPRRKVRHLYLPGPHRGLFNRKAGRVFDRVIFTEGVIDALSLTALGCENTVALFGAEGLTDEHLDLLAEGRVRTVVLALDADEAGRSAAERHRDRLLAEGISVAEIYPPAGVDWNEYLSSGGSGDEVKRLIEAAPVQVPEGESTGDLTWSKEGPMWLFSRGRLHYRLVGVREGFLSSLRVNVRVEAGGSRYLDNVDLYSARSRRSFADALSHLFGLEAQRIERDLIAMVDALEAVRERELAAASALSASPPLTDEDRRLGTELLRRPDLFDRIADDLEELGYVGEELNKQLLYLAASSRKMEDPISVLILSESASGKSLLVESVRRLMPEEEVVSLSSLSDQALNYLPEGGLLNKFLILGEAVHSEVVEHQIREMLSAHELSRLVTMKDPKTGELSARMVRSPVVVAAVMSSTAHQINPENASRAFVVHADESREQTQRIHARQRGKYTLSRHAARRERVPLIERTHQAAQRLLESRLIVNPFAKGLRFPDALMRSRRDHERFIDLIAAVCHLRQLQKEEREDLDPITGTRVRYIECDIEDYRIAYRILAGILPATASAFPKGAMLLYEQIRRFAREKAGREELRTEEVRFTQREVREATEASQMFVKRTLRLLLEWEYLRSGGIVLRGARRSYQLVADQPIELFDLSMIPAPEEMERVADG